MNGRIDDCWLDGWMNAGQRWMLDAQTDKCWMYRQMNVGCIDGWMLDVWHVRLIFECWAAEHLSPSTSWSAAVSTTLPTLWAQTLKRRMEVVCRPLAAGPTAPPAVRERRTTVQCRWDRKQGTIFRVYISSSKMFDAFAYSWINIQTNIFLFRVALNKSWGSLKRTLTSWEVLQRELVSYR